MKRHTTPSAVHSRNTHSTVGVVSPIVAPVPISRTMHQLPDDEAHQSIPAQTPTSAPQLADSRIQSCISGINSVQLADSSVQPSALASAAQLEANRRLEAWLAKYTPVEQKIYADREQRLARKAARREARAQALGDLAEATGGLSKVMLRENWSLEKMMQWADGDVFMMQCLARIFRKEAARKIDAIRHQWQRSRYYPQENERRRARAAARRSTRPRSTSNPCPTREEILDAWVHLKDSHAATIRFGSLIEDLACYLDSSLRRNEEGTIIGRNPGVKGWLQENIPALFLRYSTVMRYKSAARKLKQLTNIDDPIPAAAIVCDYGADEAAPAVQSGMEMIKASCDYCADESIPATQGGMKADGESCDYGADETQAGAKTAGDGAEKAGENGQRVVRGSVKARDDAEKVRQGNAEAKIRQARGVWLKVIADVSPYPTPLLARIDGLLGAPAESLQADFASHNGHIA